jgi:hypothetical protein
MNRADHGPLFDILVLLHLETRGPRQACASIAVVGLSLYLNDLFINEVKKR